MDAGSTSAALMLSTPHDLSITLLGPLRPDHPAQPRATSSLDHAAVVLHSDHQHTPCPPTVTSTSCSACTEHGRESIIVRYPLTASQAYPIPPPYTRSTRTSRQQMLRTPELHEALQQTRTTQTTKQEKQRYTVRAGTKNTIHQATTGLRRNHYLDLPKTHHAHLYTAIATNLTHPDT